MPRSLARKNDGCYECCKRRLRCDKTEPECLKCRKKGIQCSGQGLRCRFSSHMNSPPSQVATSQHSRSSSRRRITPASSSTIQAVPRERLTDNKTCDISAIDLACAMASRQIEPENTTRVMPLRAGLDENNLSPQARMLFDHFCLHIAPMMVVLDIAGNGYRDIILPLATQDDVLARAISVVAAFHLARKAPHLRQPAIAGHRAILERLQRDSLHLPPERIFTPYTWATIMVLLVGETITGADNYLHLLEALTCLRQSPEAVDALPSALRNFFCQQVKMFELFGFPLTSEEKGILVLQRKPDYYMDFMMYPTLPSGSEHLANLQIMRAAICDACTLYQQRTASSLATQDLTSHVEQLRQRVLPLEAHTPGAHALVWTYFVAASESILPDHRLFFSSRLREIYDLTGFGSIPAALAALETIWAMQGIKRWTEIACKDFPVLVM